MSTGPDRTVRETLDAVYRTESRRVLATLIRLLGDFDLAEEALHEAFVAATAQWPRDGVPANPRAWLISTGRFRAIDRLRRRARAQTIHNDVALWQTVSTEPDAGLETEAVEDDRLRLVFTCCHPALSPDARVALTLREVCGLTTEAIASAYLARTTAIAQRIVRAKRKIREAGIPYEVPGETELPQRLDTVLRVIYLVFNEGYSASEGDSVTRADLSAEAIRLGRLLVELLPDPEAVGLLALMLLQDSRRAARSDASGGLVRLPDQDRSLWDRDRIEEGAALVRRSLGSGRFGPYALQAAIAAVHSEARDASETDWREVVGLYDLLLRCDPSPVVELNRAVAVAMCDGPQAGLELVDGILQRGALSDYHLAHAARADFCRRLGAADQAREAYRQALALVRQGPERRFLEEQLATLEH